MEGFLAISRLTEMYGLVGNGLHQTTALK